eukprot:gene17731-24091_t
MLHITRVDGATQFKFQPPRNEHGPRKSDQGTLRPPRLEQRGVIPFEEWRVQHAYFIRCMMRSISAGLGDANGAIIWNWRGMRRDLERHLYATSSNRYTAFVLLK